MKEGKRSGFEVKSNNPFTSGGDIDNSLTQVKPTSVIRLVCFTQSKTYRWAEGHTCRFCFCNTYTCAGRGGYQAIKLEE